MKTSVQQGPLEIAEIVLRVSLLPPSVRSRLAAALARQALEEALRRRYPVDDGIRLPIRPLLVHAQIQDPDFGKRAGVAWLHLTWACHHRPEESDPDLEAVTGLVEEVRKLLG